MREIKFRAWDGKTLSAPFGLNDACYTTDDDGIHWAEGVVSFDIEGGYKIMQFTGLHDKNGREIYDGDIVKNDAYAIIAWPLVVRIDRELWSVTFNKGSDVILAYDIGSIGQLEVIGNICENPDLCA